MGICDAGFSKTLMHEQALTIVIDVSDIRLCWPCANVEATSGLENRYRIRFVCWCVFRGTRQVSARPQVHCCQQAVLVKVQTARKLKIGVHGRRQGSCTHTLRSSSQQVYSAVDLRSRPNMEPGRVCTCDLAVAWPPPCKIAVFPEHIEVAETRPK